jgi:heptosyltransferase-1
VQNAPKIILIKTSSLGDVLHNLPVVTDICKHVPGACIDWVIEENYATLPLLHPGVNRVIAVAIRRWRNAWWQSRNEIKSACRELKKTSYDFALDNQGLAKSAIITRCIEAKRCGFSWNSAREPLASLFYDHTYVVEKNQHAVERNRKLAGLALHYSPQDGADYGIQLPSIILPWLPDQPYAVLLHATSRDDKLWPEDNWIALGRKLQQMGMLCLLPWGNEAERERSERLKSAISGAICIPRINLNQAAVMLGRARVVVGVDTGLNHLAAALAVPTVGIYTTTDPGLTGLYAGDRAINLGGKNKYTSVAEVILAIEKICIHE